MKRTLTATLAALALPVFMPGVMPVFIPAAQASDIRVAPVVLDPLPGARTTSLTLTNDENRPVRVQLRVMKWSMENGREQLTPTDDVVASPPFATLSPQQQYLVRVVRTAKTPPRGEETYRVLVDEVPEPGDVRPGTVNLVVRQSIPAFFSDLAHRDPDVAWSVQNGRDGATLVGRNSGNRRMRVADLSIDTAGRQVYFQQGLVGYVLAGSELRVPLAMQEALPADGRLRLTAVAAGGRLEGPLATRSTK